jgi:hypothetical protein
MYAVNFEKVYKKDRTLPPNAEIEAGESHMESREVWTEIDKFKILEWKENEHGIQVGKTKVEHRENVIKVHYSEWGWVDDGGGHFTEIPGDPTHHYEKRTETRRMNEWNKKFDLSFQTWEDQTEEFVIPQADLVHINIKPKYVASDQDIHWLNCEVNKKKNLADNFKNAHADAYFNTAGFVKHGYTGSRYGRFVCMSKFGRSCIFKLLWFISFLVGYSFCVESIFLFTPKEYYTTVTKRVSTKNDLRAKWGERDECFEILEI